MVFLIDLRIKKTIIYTGMIFHNKFDINKRKGESSVRFCNE